MNENNSNEIKLTREQVIDSLQDSFAYYDRLLSSCQKAALEDPGFMPEEFALDMLRGFHHLRTDLRVLAGIPAQSGLSPFSASSEEAPTENQPVKKEDRSWGA